MKVSFVLAVEIPCEWNLATESTIVIDESDGLVHSGQNYSLQYSTFTDMSVLLVPAASIPSQTRGVRLSGLLWAKKPRNDRDFISRAKKIILPPGFVLERSKNPPTKGIAGRGSAA